MNANVGANARCAHCGADFHCGVNDAEPCACTRIALAATTLAALRERYAGCLCLACLSTLSAREALDPAAPAATMRDSI